MVQFYTWTYGDLITYWLVTRFTLSACFPVHDIKQRTVCAEMLSRNTYLRLYKYYYTLRAEVAQPV
jgi:hypothetical protein